jgi:hypothetical protein
MPASRRAAHAVAAAIGLGMVLFVFGPGYVLGTSDYWNMPWLDHRSYVMGYRYFLHEPWHWPIFDARTLNVPYSQSIAFNDSMPLWALIHKVIATVIPPWRDYSARAFLGLWYVLASMLQPVFGVAILRALGHRSWGATIVTSVFFIAIPAWTLRFLHASLYGHFLLLSALYLYLITPASAPAPRRVRVLQLVQLGVAALLNPYHTVMSLAVFAASLVRSRAWRPAAVWFASGCAVVVAALALGGYFAAPAATWESGFGVKSSNLLSPFLPIDSGWIGRVAWTDPTGNQYEGMCYLGAGLLVLALVFLPRARDALTTARGHAALAVVAGGAAILALSNRIFLGSHRVLVYPIPHVLDWIPSQFRVPGRFSWLPMYVVAVFLLSQGFRRFATGWKRLVLPVLAVVQLVDVTPILRDYRGMTRGPFPSQLDAAAWRPLLASSDQVKVFPPHACERDDFEPATRLQYLASERAVPINGVYGARVVRDCAADVASLLDFHAQPGTLYVFVAPTIGVAKRLAASGMPCAEFSFGAFCHSDRALIERLPVAPLSPVAPLAYGDKLDVAARGAPFLELGWAEAEATGRWTDGPVARLLVRPAGTPPLDPVLRLEASARLCGARAAQDVTVLVAGTVVGTLHFDASSNDQGRARAISVPRSALLASPLVEIELRSRDIRSPYELACGRDGRQLGVRLGHLWIESAGSP